MQILLQNKPLQSIDHLTPFLKELGKKNNISKYIISEIDLALNELLINIINYGGNQGKNSYIHLDFKIEKTKITFTLTDTGIDFNPLEHKSESENKDIKNKPIGGLGILVVKKSMDSLSYMRKNNTNILKLVKMIKP